MDREMDRITAGRDPTLVVSPVLLDIDDRTLTLGLPSSALGGLVARNPNVVGHGIGVPIEPQEGNLGLRENVLH